LFIINLVGVFALNGMARRDQTVVMQWVEESLQVCIQLSFAIAAWMMKRRASHQPSIIRLQES